MILIGSAAIKYWYPDFPREPKDLDYIRTENKHKILPKLNLRSEVLQNDILAELYPEHTILSPKDLLTLKASHLFWNLHWEKHMNDTQFLINKGNKIDKELFFKLYEYWNTIHSKNKRSNTDDEYFAFFDNKINLQPEEHDKLHLILSSTPIYIKVLNKPTANPYPNFMYSVGVSEDKFKALSYEDKLNFVREEVMVMGYERFKNNDYNLAYKVMLKKFLMNHAPIWSTIFIIENYEVLSKCQYNFITKLNNGTKTGK